MCTYKAKAHAGSYGSNWYKVATDYITKNDNMKSAPKRNKSNEIFLFYGFELKFQDSYAALPLTTSEHWILPNHL